METTQRPLTDIEVADRLGLSAKTLKAWRLRGRGPRFVRFGRAVRYTTADVDDFIRKNTIETSMSDASVSD